MNAASHSFRIPRLAPETADILSSLCLHSGSVSHISKTTVNWSTFDEVPLLLKAAAIPFSNSVWPSMDSECTLDFAVSVCLLVLIPPSIWMSSKRHLETCKRLFAKRLSTSGDKRIRKFFSFQSAVTWLWQTRRILNFNLELRRLQNI